MYGALVVAIGVLGEECLSSLLLPSLEQHKVICVVLEHLIIQFIYKFIKIVIIVLQNYNFT